MQVNEATGTSGSEQDLINSFSTYNAARMYAMAGWTVVPVRPTDHGCTLRPLAMLSGLGAAPTDCGIGLVTGKLSGIFVLESDEEGLATLEDLEYRFGVPLATVTTDLGKHWHFYFSHPGGDLPHRTRLLPGVTLHGEGSVITIPPSRLPSGDYCCWNSHDDTISAAPEWLLRLIASERGSRKAA